jgi:ArsR family metal-binding transcriptional regulator
VVEAKREKTPVMAYLNEIKIIGVMPCLAEPVRIRFVAEFDRDISEVMPYVNAVIDGAIYNHAGHSITLKKGDKIIGVEGKQIAANQVIDMKDAENLIQWFKEIVNTCYEKRDSIKPNYERRGKLTALDIYRFLPGTNCKRCGELTCLALAVKVADGEKSIIVCADLLSGKFDEKKNELVRILQSCGYSVPPILI